MLDLMDLKVGVSAYIFFRVCQKYVLLNFVLNITLHSQEKADVESSKELSRLRQLLRTKEECIDALEVKMKNCEKRGGRCGCVTEHMIDERQNDCPQTGKHVQYE